MSRNEKRVDFGKSNAIFFLHPQEEIQVQKEKRTKTTKIQADDPISFLQLSSGKENLLGENLFESSLNQALAGTKSKLDIRPATTRIGKPKNTYSSHRFV